MTKPVTHKPGRGRVYNSITETIGDTPLVRMARMPQAAGVKADLLFKHVGPGRARPIVRKTQTLLQLKPR